MFECEELAGAAKAGEHLVENEERARTIASLTERADESRLGDTHPALCLHRLDHDSRNRGIDLVERRFITKCQMAHRPRQCAERIAESRVSSQRERAHRIAVIRTVERDESRSPGKFSPPLERTFNHLPPPICESTPL